MKYCRKAKKLTQEHLAELIDVSPHYIYELERGSKCMSVATLSDIARTLNISVDYLLYGPYSPENSTSPPSDRLELLIQNLSPQRRESLADILKTLLPYLK